MTERELLLEASDYMDLGTADRERLFAYPDLVTNAMAFEGATGSGLIDAHLRIYEERCQEFSLPLDVAYVIELAHDRADKLKIVRALCMRYGTRRMQYYFGEIIEDPL